MRPSFRILTVWLVLGGAVLAGAEPDGSQTARAELHGTVADTAGLSLAGVSIQLRAGERTVASTATGADGAFRLRFSGEPAELARAGPLRLRAERLGYRTHEMPLPGDLTEPIRIVLTPAPLPLPGFEVDAGPRECTGDDADGIGRTLWERAAALHPGALDTLGVATYTRSSTDTLDNPDQVTEWDEHGYEDGQRGSAPILRIGWARRIDRQGYAFPVRRTDRTGSFDSWSYAPLEADFASHFGTEQFGRRHYFQLLSQGADGWTVRYCARDERDPYLVGRLEMGADTLIRRAEWRFHTPKPDEKAGGWAVFPPADPPHDPPPLLPLESLNWKSLPSDRILRRAQWFEGWILAPGDSVPFLPRRHAEGRDAARRD